MRTAFAVALAAAVALVPVALNRLRDRDWDPKLTTTAAAVAVDAPDPEGFERFASEPGGYSIAVPKGSTLIAGTDAEIHDNRFEVRGSTALPIAVLVGGWAHHGTETPRTPARVAQTAGPVNGRAVIEKGPLPRGAYAVTVPMKDPREDERCIRVELVGAKVMTSAECCGANADGARMDAVCRSLRVMR